jgi:D-sedoheptulose 7-phosphate isomerase
MHLNQYLAETASAAQATRPQSLYALAHGIFTVWQRRQTVFTCGNGGSANNANHLAQDLAKATIVPNAPRLNCVSLCANVGALTAWANDEGYEHCFSEQLLGQGRQGDFLIALSGSGNSPNVLNAVHAAHELEMRTWGITGFDGGKLTGIAHRCVRVPCGDMGQVEAVHGVLFHWLVDYLRQAFDDARHARLSILEAWVPQ